MAVIKPYKLNVDMKQLIEKVIPFAHQILKKAIPIDGHVLDGTAGNGYDTLFLAECVGHNGHVWAFDIQQQALDNTLSRLKEYNMAHQVTLIADGHEHLERYINQPLDAAIFNFGWLPGGDKQCTTHLVTSIQALNATLSLLKPNGVIMAVLYPGHEAGRLEADGIEEWAKQLPQKIYAVLKYHFINQCHFPPYLLAIEKLG